MDHELIAIVCAATALLALFAGVLYLGGPALWSPPVFWAAVALGFLNSLLARKRT